MDKNVVLRGYLSHQIRGRKADKCTDEEVQANCAKAAQDGAQLMAHFQRCGLPVYLHIPGAQDEFVQRAYKAGRITEKEILDTDCDIISGGDFLLVYDWDNYYSTGMQTEWDFADGVDMPTFVLHKLDTPSVWELMEFVLGLLLSKITAPTIIKLSDNCTDAKSV